MHELNIKWENISQDTLSELAVINIFTVGLCCCYELTLWISFIDHINIWYSQTHLLEDHHVLIPRQPDTFRFINNQQKNKLATISFLEVKKGKGSQEQQASSTSAPSEICL